ncbi:MAG TPA: ATP-binding protein [Planctomycetota bacterium]|nr:ATP-binding protein [Planctomycetota bacterium]
MATAAQVKALIESHAQGDAERFYNVALQVAAHAARTGHTRFATELRELIDKAKAGATSRPPSKPIPFVQPRGELAGLLTAGYPKQRLHDLVLEPALHNRIQKVLREQRQQERLKEHGFKPQRKLLLIGPPGTGKTMTAGVLAGELGLPLFTIQLHALITKFMGETAAKLRLIFDAMLQTRAVYLFDEFDAFGSDRGAKNDVGEIRRVLNSFLLFLEQDESDSLVIAATNHHGLLDRALFRRFDAFIEYTLPSSALAKEIMRVRLGVLEVEDVDWNAATNAASGLSHAEIARACEQAAKHAILEHTTKVETDVLVAALTERQSSRS